MAGKNVGIALNNSNLARSKADGQLFFGSDHPASKLYKAYAEGRAHLAAGGIEADNPFDVLVDPAGFTAWLDGAENFTLISDEFETATAGSV